MSNRLSEAELVRARKRRAAGEASLACEGMYLTSEQRSRFNRFEQEGLTHAERRRQIIEFYRAKAKKADRLF
jgi:hypothetical protein